MSDRTTAQALRAYEHAKNSDESIGDALETLQEVNETAEWDFEAMPDVDP